MNINDILKIVKSKIFEPKKKLVFDSLGNINFVNCENWKEEQNRLTEENKAILNDGDGWNLADKDYVNLKTGLCFFDRGKLSKEQNTFVFFYPGILLNEKTIFSKLNLFSDFQDEELDLTLSLKNMNNNNSTIISKFQLKNKLTSVLNLENEHVLNSQLQDMFILELTLTADFKTFDSDCNFSLQIYTKQTD